MSVDDSIIVPPVSPPFTPAQEARIVALIDEALRAHWAGIPVGRAVRSIRGNIEQQGIAALDTTHGLVEHDRTGGAERSTEDGKRTE